MSEKQVSGIDIQRAVAGAPAPHRTPPVGCATRPVIRFERGKRAEDDDRLAEEVPVAMHFDGQPFAVMMTTPADLDDFARGFAFTEGKVGSVLDIVDIEVREVLEGIVVDIRTATGLAARQDAPAVTHEPAARELPGRSGCGICGSRELEDVVRHPAPVAAGPTVPVDAIERALEALRARQPINAFTGSVHAAAWSLPDGSIVKVREDVGRHNALDKLIGAMLVDGTDPRDGFLVITSRASYEMVTKAAVAGITMVVAISAPTALAVHLAADCGVTLLGFARPGRFNIYTRAERVMG
ncbi:FdhD protein [Luteibacter sp. UNC138MFCol5.1]|uniref:formate dehydrogenase accessory sulfurtransferase FdhD n=1 Tax=Luteibacter sp. UNC138MFCol5.1 TaxID=1502774 RepID=UPI0008CA636A|nr:formate dehydrogenase accessory sulfurtransferase FdhD [Luteibacter sp. UNC138MFCol5.1]SEO47259.1 FdhD protein [Luteibacter sp. UNC138MFCol5.1]